MPHCQIEYTESVLKETTETQLLDTVFDAVSTSALFDPTTVRTTAQSYSDCRLGASQSQFVHVTIRLIDGRSHGEKSELTQRVGHAITQLGITDSVISCECVDIHGPSYFRSTT